MDLFGYGLDEPINIITEDGDVKYYAIIIEQADADAFFQQLLTKVAWQNDVATIMGKTITTKRKVAWYGDEPYKYTYSNNTKQALVWTPELLKLKAIAEKHSGETFNSCLLNLYHDGSEGMAWHSDGEKDLKTNGAIGSLSFGAERKFAFKHKKSKHKVDLKLQHGSLLVMKGSTQSHWMHRLPPTKTVSEARINLTFRTIVRNQTTSIA